ncbi:MAG TPA: alkaline phosphatase family protein [Acidimicrobiales bacterium]
MSSPRRHTAAAAVVLAGSLLLAACSSGSGNSSATTTTTGSSSATSTSTTAGHGVLNGIPAAIHHVFLIVLENRSYDETWGTSPGAPYLATTLRAEGNLLTQYFATSHVSLGNYISMVSGQPANPVTQADCVSDYENVTPATVVNGIATGVGCVYPPAVGTIAGQLQTAGLTWKGYMESMAQPCQHPVLGQPDQNVVASATSLYATRHNPFVYFSALTGSSACTTGDVPLTQLAGDLATVASTPNYSFITPNLCDDGHDATCAAGGPAGYAGINAFLQTWVPKILGSAAYKKDGLLLITFDEAEALGAQQDDTACCHEPPSISAGGTQTGMAGGGGPGGGRVGLLALSPFIAPGSTTATPYNHFSMLRSIEDIFGLPHLGEAAAPGLASFGADVFTKPAG